MPKKKLKATERFRYMAKSRKLRKRRRYCSFNKWYLKKARKNPKKYYTLRYNGIILRYFSVRHEIQVNDLQVALFIYNAGDFTREEFYNYSELVLGRRLTLKRYMKLGYAIPEIRVKKFERKKDEKVLTGKYEISKQLLKIVLDIYRKQEKLLNADERPNSTEIGPKASEIINAMKREMYEIKAKKRKSEPIMKFVEL